MSYKYISTTSWVHLVYICFRVDHIVLHNQLRGYFLGKTNFPPLASDCSSYRVKGPWNISHIHGSLSFRFCFGHHIFEILEVWFSVPYRTHGHSKTIWMLCLLQSFCFPFRLRYRACTVVVSVGAQHLTVCILSSCSFLKCTPFAATSSFFDEGWELQIPVSLTHCPTCYSVNQYPRG